MADMIPVVSRLGERSCSKFSRMRGTLLLVMTIADELKCSSGASMWSCVSSSHATCFVAVLELACMQHLQTQVYRCSATPGVPSTKTSVVTLLVALDVSSGHPVPLKCTPSTCQPAVQRQCVRAHGQNLPVSLHQVCCRVAAGACSSSRACQFDAVFVVLVYTPCFDLQT